MTPIWAGNRFPVVAVSRLADIQLGKMLQPTPSTPADQLTPYLRAGSLSRLDADVYPEMFASQVDRSRYEVREGDLVVAEGGDMGRAEFARAVPANTIIQNSLLRLRFRTADARFIKFALDAVHASGWLEVYCSKSTFGHLTREKLAALRIPAPSLSAQRAIADYLDVETRRIGSLVAARRRQVELLALHRQAVISSSFDVGPLVPVRRVISLCTSGPRGWGDLVGDEGVMFLRSANLARDTIEIKLDNLAFVPAQATAEGARSRVRAGDTLIGITGANTGWTGLVRPRLEGSYISQHVAILRPHSILPEWLAYSIASDKVQRILLGSQYGGTKTQLGLEDLRELVICVPDLETQRSVMRRIARLEADTASAVGAMNSQIELLVEHGQALTAAAVTGQLDIPGVAA